VELGWNTLRIVSVNKVVSYQPNSFVTIIDINYARPFG
jgi:hypothetical protein